MIEIFKNLLNSVTIYTALPEVMIAVTFLYQEIAKELNDFNISQPKSLSSNLILTTTAHTQLFIKIKAT